MKNIERFNLYTAYIFGRLYDEFPVARKIDVTEVVAALKLPTQPGVHADPTKENNFVAHTLAWLVDTGYLIMRKAGGESGALCSLAQSVRSAKRNTECS
jgi:hypothetical protein